MERPLLGSKRQHTRFNTYPGLLPLQPDWVIKTRAGPTPFPGWNAALKDPTSSNTTYAIGRYAYAVYDEGGLLDMNVGGYPTGGRAFISTVAKGL